MKKHDFIKHEGCSGSGNHCTYEGCNEPREASVHKTRKRKNTEPAPIPLFLGTSYSYDPEKETGPLMTLVESGELNGEKIYDIQFGPVKIGEVRLIGRAYSLHWLATGGNFCGNGELPVSGPTLRGDILKDGLAQATLAAHIFEVLARDLREYIEESK